MVGPAHDDRRGAAYAAFRRRAADIQTYVHAQLERGTAREPIVVEFDAPLYRVATEDPGELWRADGNGERGPVRGPLWRHGGGGPIFGDAQLAVRGAQPAGLTGGAAQHGRAAHVQRHERWMRVGHQGAVGAGRGSCMHARSERICERIQHITLGLHWHVPRVICVRVAAPRARRSARRTRPGKCG